MKKILLVLVPLVITMLGFIEKNNFRISGTVTDAYGNPIASATVKLKAGNTVASVDLHGYYNMTVPTPSGTLVFSAPGYQPKEEKIKGRQTLNVVMQTTAVALNEIVVAGYGKKLDRRQTALAPAVVKSTLTYQANQDYYQPPFNTEGYDYINENTFRKAAENPLSTFSIDVDGASYSNVRRMLHAGQIPAAGAVRVEEMINYFQYDYPQPKKDVPFSFVTEINDCPWNSQNKLVLIGMQGKKIAAEDLPAANLVFLIDVSGSMSDANKLPLVKASLKMLTDQLRDQDKVSIVVYAGAAGLVLPPTSGQHKTAIKDALEKLDAGGSTAGGAGIQLAYKTARENFAAAGNNRVILCSDGDFNIGMSSDDEMERLIEQERKSGVYLTVLGFGMGNYKDNKMQKLANKGNGNHAYIDGMGEAKKVLVNEFGGTMFTIAKDVKLQVEFNPAFVQGYRLVGYENRMLNKEDFNDDDKDAGDLGSGHTVTALYEIIPVGVESSFLKNVDPLKYQKQNMAASENVESEMMTIKFRYKTPGDEKSKLLVHPLLHKALEKGQASENFRFAAAVAEFGMLLRNSTFKAEASYSSVLRSAGNALSYDKEGYRREFIRLVESAQFLAGKQEPIEIETRTR